MARTMSYTETLEVTRCRCGIGFAVPDNLLRSAHDDGYTIHCPLGHTLTWRETEADRLRKELERQKQATARESDRVKFWREEQERTAKTLSVTKGQLTKTRKRIAGGACPCCKRSFVDVARHMATKHPDFMEADGAARPDS